MNAEDNAPNHPAKWKYISPAEGGLHPVVTPQNSDCRTTWLYRLNLDSGEEYKLWHDELEQHLFVFKGSLTFSIDGEKGKLSKLDSFYIPSKTTAVITAVEPLFAFIGSAPYEGVGVPYIRKYDGSLPLGDTRQIHGEPPFQRDVFMCLGDTVPASRLICGVTWGEEGKWTSWPPHQHSSSLEEVYCYFDIPRPGFALHLCSRKKGIIEAVHPVATGDCIAIPEGYHPTVGMPGIRSCYYWVMAAHNKESRRYDLAKADFM